MSSDAAWLSVMNLDRALPPNFCQLGLSVQRTNGEQTRTGPFDLDEIDIVRRSMDHGPESHRIGDLSMEPDIFVGREKPSQLGAHDPDDIAQHRNKYGGSIKGENKACAARCPN